MSNNGAFDPETDGLTPGEQHVLALIREGRLDAEIAVRLGVSVGDVKDRIQRILRKLDLSERRDLLDPSAERRVPAPEAEVIIDATGGRPAPPTRAALWTLVAKVVAAPVILAIGAMWIWSGDSGARDGQLPYEEALIRISDETIAGRLVESGTPGVYVLAPAASPTPSPPSPAEVVNGIAFPQMTVTETAIFPDNLVLYVRNPGITQGNGLFRFYRLGGVTHSERIFPPLTPGKVVSADAAPDGSDIVVAVCSRESCLDEVVDPDGKATYYRSRDGGITWAVDFVVARGTWVSGVSHGRYLVRQAEANTMARWLVVENGISRSLTPPTLNLRYTPQRPYLGSDGKVVWLADTVVLDEDGRFLFALPITGAVSLAPTPEGWRVRTSFPNMMVQVTRQGGVIRAFSTRAVLSPAALFTDTLGAGTAGAGAGATIAPGIGGAPGQSLPVLIGMAAGTLQVLTDPFEKPPFLGLSNHVIAARFETFARVNTPGDCLNLREGPNIEAPVLACVPDGVLLTVSGVPSQPGFLPVQMPGGPFGFAATGYLLR